MKAPSSDAGNTEGMCGNFNGISTMEDELSKGRDGTFHGTNVVSFGDSWRYNNYNHNLSQYTWYETDYYVKMVPLPTPVVVYNDHVFLIQSRTLMKWLLKYATRNTWLQTGGAITVLCVIWQLDYEFEISS